MGNLGDHVKSCTTAEDTTSRRGRWSQEHLKIVKIPSRETKGDEEVRLCLLLRAVGRRVRDETETYSPGSGDLSAGRNSFRAAFSPSLVVPEIPRDTFALPFAA